MQLLEEKNTFHQELRQSVRSVCQKFPDTYWRELDANNAYPEEFVHALTKAGFLAALIPEEYGGSGLGITEASIIPRPDPPYSSGISAARKPALVSAWTNSSG